MTVVVLKQDVASYVFTLFVLFPVFLTFVWFATPWINRRIANPRVQERLCFLLGGSVGLLIEWFLIGLSPWSNPNANPLLMMIFQLGMFSFWATVAFVPRLLVLPGRGCRCGTTILRFYAPYFVLVYVVGLTVPVSLRFVVIIPLILVGYLVVSVLCLKHLYERPWTRERPDV